MDYPKEGLKISSSENSKSSIPCLFESLVSGSAYEVSRQKLI